MAEDTTPNTPSTEPAGAGEQRQPGQLLRVMAQYVKDLSFENPANSQVRTQPNIDLGIDVGATPHVNGNGVYEVSLKLSAEAKAEADTLFIMELDYAGLFQLGTQNQAEMEPLLLIECPRLLFPFARRIIAEITREGGFPPLLIDPVDFVALYRQQKERQAQAQAAGTEGGLAETPAQTLSI